ncbi:Tigger transposable element-derived protein 5 [Ceratobasidium sp. 428]|nr:Tigger transposable element-derived protein 5 [Ceratobasidium sp. 428]
MTAVRSRNTRPTRQLSSADEVELAPKRKYLTFWDKLKIIDFYCANRHLTQSEVAEHFQGRYPKIVQGSVSRYMSQETEIRRYVAKYPNRLGYARPIHVTVPELEEALVQWVKTSLRHGQTVLTDEMIYEKGRQLSQSLDIPDAKRDALKFSSCWLKLFKERTGLRSILRDGKAVLTLAELSESDTPELQPITAPLSGPSNPLVSGVNTGSSD